MVLHYTHEPLHLQSMHAVTDASCACRDALEGKRRGGWPSVTSMKSMPWLSPGNSLASRRPTISLATFSFFSRYSWGAMPCTQGPPQSKGVGDTTPSQAPKAGARSVNAALSVPEESAQRTAQSQEHEAPDRSLASHSSQSTGLQPHLPVVDPGCCEYVQDMAVLWGQRIVENLHSSHQGAQPCEYATILAICQQALWASEASTAHHVCAHAMRSLLCGVACFLASLEFGSM